MTALTLRLGLRLRILGEEGFRQSLLSFDCDADGHMNAIEFMAYLKAVGEWGTHPLYSDQAQWTTESWPMICLLLDVADVTVGVPLDCFANYSERFGGGAARQLSPARGSSTVHSSTKSSRAAPIAAGQTESHATDHHETTEAAQAAAAEAKVREEEERQQAVSVVRLRQLQEKKEVQAACTIQAVERGRRGRQDAAARVKVASMSAEQRRKKLHALGLRLGLRLRILGEELFQQVVAFDLDGSGYIDQAEFKAYLQAVGEWRTDALYTDAEWEASWPSMCEQLGIADPQTGIPIAVFTSGYSTWTTAATY